MPPEHWTLVDSSGRPPSGAKKGIQTGSRNSLTGHVDAHALFALKKDLFLRGRILAGENFINGVLRRVVLNR